MPRSRRMRFATRILLLQLSTVVLVVALCTGVYLFLAAQQLRAQAESSALGIARTLAEQPQIREGVATASADPGTPRAEDLRDGVLQRIATATAGRTGALFVVITDDHGIRLAHPDPARLGQEVSTPFQDVLAGHEVVEWDTGTLGESARAKVPVRSATGAPIGEVSVGFARAGVFDDLPPLLAVIGLAAAGSLLLAGVGAVLLRRRWERLTLGVQPEELVALVQNQTAVLDGVADGVLAVDEAGVVRVCNAAAERLLDVRDAVGRPLARIGLPDAVRDAVSGERTLSEAVLGDRVLYLETRPVERDGRPLGTVAVIRDRTELVALSERLETVRTMTAALRVQRHEFANRIHVAAGLLDAERVQDARDFLAQLADRGSVDFPVPGIARLRDPFLRSFLGAKALEASERGVTLRIAEETHLLGAVSEAEDVAAVLGNLVDNAVTAAVGGAQPRWVEVSVLDDRDALVVTVADSGAGLDGGPGTAPEDLDGGSGTTSEDLDGGRTGAGGEAEAGPVHGHGVGLRLSREIARRGGGDLWIIDRGGGEHGAVFAARLGGVVTPTRGRDPQGREDDARIDEEENR
ncbi:Signal transduction histidine kinase CitA regulating citrate metabolism [Microbacterium sp. 8M]|uniref:sensor histidine kinase n=1 Tax=Microbacterium sp. 8M TaxID=2653153 RepID=UPI0012F2E1C0|nr:sensor histidine kinase [Microbacterium sp. 8M]VXB32816.1 Signal transduction histidine kinase CitA regulating citrate metabolism [Microbacterium sp. 8M]